MSTKSRCFSSGVRIYSEFVERILLRQNDIFIIPLLLCGAHRLHQVKKNYVLYPFHFPTILIIYSIYIIVSVYSLSASIVLFSNKNIVDFNYMDALSFDIDKLIKICRENDAAMVGVFGSVARGEDTSESDIDLIW